MKSLLTIRKLLAASVSGKKSRARVRAHRAFSLVETVLALGVASFAMITLLGLIPLGLKTSRDAIDITAHSQIVQLIRNQVQLSDFNNLEEWNNQKLYYNEQGLEVEAGDPAQVFTATLVVGEVDAFNSTSTLPKEVARTITIYLSNKTAPQTVQTFTIVAANTGF